MAGYRGKGGRSSSVSSRGGRGAIRRNGVPGYLNYRSGSYGAPYAPPMTSARSDGRGFLKAPAGRYVNPYTGRSDGRGPRVFQPGVYVNSGRDRGSTFIPYTGGGGSSARPSLGRQSLTPDRPRIDPTPEPEPAPEEPAPTPRGKRGIRIRNSPARRTAVSRGRRARGSRRSARIERSLSGLSIGSRSGITI